MLSRPELSDDAVAAALVRRYGLPVERLDFLPIGNDAAAWSYRVRAKAGRVYFAKLRAGAFNLAALAVPRYLNAHGIRQIVAPLPDKDGNLCVRVGRFSLALYPFVDSRSAMETGLSRRQRVDYGAFLGSLHAAALPRPIRGLLRRERFVPAWAGTVRALRDRIRTADAADRYEAGLAEIWRVHGDVIDRLLRTAEELGKRLQDRNPVLVTCHGDIHTANLLLEDDAIRVVDWDEIVLAPRERDLMFVVAADKATGTTTVDPDFGDGYGPVSIDPLAMAYYRYEWVVQEIGDYGARIAMDPTCGEETRADAVAGLRQLFEAGDVVDAALRSPTA